MKNFAKAVTSACTTKEQKKLLPWLPELKNHIWWASQACNGDAEYLVELVRSVQYHVLNVHTELPLQRVTRCAHEPLEE